MTDLIPGFGERPQQVRHLVEHGGVIHHIGMHKATQHVVVDRVEIARDAATSLHVETAAQMLDDRDGARDRTQLGRGLAARPRAAPRRSEEHTSALTSLKLISYAVYCLKQNNK